MTELRFHRDLYAEKAVKDAVAKFVPYAEVTCVDAPEGAGWLVTIAAAREDREQRIARELANFALGFTVRARTEA